MSQKYSISTEDATSRLSAVKAWRVLFNLSLRDAMHDIDEMRSKGRIERFISIQEADKLRVSGFNVVSLSGNVKPRKVSIYIPDDNRKIYHIKNLRHASGVMGLKQAKDIMDEMWSMNSPVYIDDVGEAYYYALLDAGFTVSGFTLEMFKEHEDLFTI